MTSQNILITGTSSGFGLLATETLARQGHTVFATMRGVNGKNAESATKLQQLAKDENLHIHVLDLDVTNQVSIDSAVNAIREHSDRLDVLVNNAGIFALSMTESFTDEQARWMFDTNYFGVSNLTRAVLPIMKQQGSGLIINISSGVGRLVFPGIAHYAASKFALEAYSEVLRYELASQGIDVTIVEPGAYSTGLGMKMTTGEDSSRLEGYGDLAKMPEMMAQSFEQMFSDPNFNPPQEVADAIAGLVNAEFGKRPLRTVCGSDIKPAIEPLNEYAAERERDMLNAFGMGDFGPLAS